MRQVLYLSHGSPDLVLRQHPARDFLTELGRRLPPPRGALVVSAHYETPDIRLGAAPAPETLHDFSGFPEALYRLRYPAPGLPEAAKRLADRLGAQGLSTRLEPERPLDHGVWSPLSLVWPEARVPLMPVSVPMAASHDELRRYARTLGEFAEAEGLWLIGSGAATHNLGDRKPFAAPPDAWAQAFHDWVRDRAAAGDPEALLAWETRAPAGRHAHPTAEHLLPLLICAAALEGEPLRALHESFTFGNLSMLMLASPPLAGAWERGTAA
ncbi:DODA-type extradiol aromatic ring-opening family dioxygenase [Halomonas sp. 328]|uniref:DODA-type extradiol aromatic ring-opening family dioxygenase n=1 Tax=Halomonas sp. 328 TaxID=2776704 RepID=UPI0018A6D769|nr:class III extradiol ring-cleavage dioxygenase [Halomonas sp. 328]MBF8222794.1 dioxygenase [Halomonas sp. 328]